MLKLENFTIIILNYNIFQLVTSLLDTNLSHFIRTADDGSDDFWTKACYLLVQNNIKYLNIQCCSHDTALLFAGSHDTA